MRIFFRVFPALILILLISSCRSMNNLTIGVTSPAPVFIHSSNESIGVLNRSLPTERNRAMDKIDEVLSIEGRKFDSDGAEQSIRGLITYLDRNQRFVSSKQIDTDTYKSPGMGVFPSALSWEEVNKISDQNNIDVLYELSFYDTETRVAYETIPVEIRGPLGVNIPAVEHQVIVTTLIKCGWRIYDRSERVILDEFIQNQSVRTVGRGINPLKAAEAIVGRREAVMDVSTDMGEVYASRIFPVRTRVSREYFVRGTENFKIGKRRAQTGDWDGAADLWEIETENRKRKVAGRAYYNMGIINEINGDLEAALEWASRSYTDYRIKDAIRYVNVLQRRMRVEAVLEEQEKN